MPINSAGEYVDQQAALYAARGQAPAAKADVSVAELETALFGADGFTFGDLLDVINPLQHIPIVSTIYRQITGDEIDAGPRVAGDGLFGGIVGLVSGLINVAVEHETGKDVGGHVMALFDGDDEPAATGFAALEAKPGTASGGDTPAPAHTTHAARQYAAAAEPDPIYGHTLDIGP